jgi:hypothetical protein
MLGRVTAGPALMQPTLFGPMVLPDWRIGPKNDEKQPTMSCG